MVMEEQESNPGLASESIPVPQVRDSLQRPCEEMLNQEGNVSRAKPRLRKKALHALILKQMEFYFSDANLSKDRFLGTLIKEDPYVDLNVFLRFNKIRVLTDDVNRVAKALKNSAILSLSKDGAKVCRTTPINPRDNCEACTVYVQGLPPDANHEWLSNLFSQYGTLAYISIPRYKSSRKIKGFAFVEFDEIEGANVCLEAFRKKNCTLPSHTEPHELLSITTFAEAEPSREIMPSSVEPAEPNGQTTSMNKRKSENNQTSDDEEIPTKKVRGDEFEEGEEREVQEDAIEKLSESVREEQDEPTKVETSKIDDGKKRKRKRKHRSRIERVDAADLGLQIMAKRDWKQLRNKYLQLQRNKMKQLKQHLHKARWNQWGGSNNDRKEKMETEQVDKKDHSKERVEPAAPKFSFTPGAIVKISLDEPCTNPKNFKLDLRNDTMVKYIDVYEGSSEAFVRCDNAEAANSFINKYRETKNLQTLEGKEEKAYWTKILRDREEKLNKKDRVKQRGRDKLLKKAEKELGKHIKFDEV